MYSMKNIIIHDSYIELPKCMYQMKNPTDILLEANDINIRNQVPNKEMIELEQRQEQLLKKLDVLFDKIKSISGNCQTAYDQDLKLTTLPVPEEVVLVVDPDNLPFFLNILLKHKDLNVAISWHIHSSVTNDEAQKIKTFMDNLQIPPNSFQINFRLIFKSVGVDSELKLSSTAVPVIGHVNIMRYLSLVYPDAIYYDQNDYVMDYLLDLCHLLERTQDKNKETIINKLFSHNKDWIYEEKFSIVDLVAFNIIKQWKNCNKSVSKVWLKNCEKLCC